MVEAGTLDNVESHSEPNTLLFRYLFPYACVMITSVGGLKQNPKDF